MLLFELWFEWLKIFNWFACYCDESVRNESWLSIGCACEVGNGIG